LHAERLVSRLVSEKVRKWQTASKHGGLGGKALCFVLAWSGFFDELGFELHRTEAVDLAVDVVVAFNQADVFDFGADLDDSG
jgi:hypothetical protein